MNTVYQIMIKEYKPCDDLLGHWILLLYPVSIPISNLKRMISESLRKKTLICSVLMHNAMAEKQWVFNKC